MSQPFSENDSVTLHKDLFQEESLFYAHVTSRAVWHLTLCKISPSLDSYFGHMVNWQIMWGLIWGQTDLRRWRGGFQFSFTYPTKSLVFLPSRITENMDFKVKRNINCSQISKNFLIMFKGEYDI